MKREIRQAARDDQAYIVNRHHWYWVADTTIRGYDGQREQEFSLRGVAAEVESLGKIKRHGLLSVVTFGVFGSRPRRTGYACLVIRGPDFVWRAPVPDTDKPRRFAARVNLAAIRYATRKPNTEGQSS